MRGSIDLLIDLGGKLGPRSAAVAWREVWAHHRGGGRCREPSCPRGAAVSEHTMDLDAAGGAMGGGSSPHNTMWADLSYEVQQAVGRHFR